jgi:hypothetical protein
MALIPFSRRQFSGSRVRRPKIVRDYTTKQMAVSYRGAAIPFTLFCVFFCLLWLKDLHDDRKAFHHSQGVYSGF